jgi:hypothetical protein
VSFVLDGAVYSAVNPYQAGTLTISGDLSYTAGSYAAVFLAANTLDLASSASINANGGDGSTTNEVGGAGGSGGAGGTSCALADKMAGAEAMDWVPTTMAAEARVRRIFTRPPAGFPMERGERAETAVRGAMRAAPEAPEATEPEAVEVERAQDRAGITISRIQRAGAAAWSSLSQTPSLERGKSALSEERLLPPPETA